MSDTALFLCDALYEVFDTGETKFTDDDAHYLIDAINSISWNDASKFTPESFPRYTGRSSIPCLVVASGKVTVCRRYWSDKKQQWVWSRGLSVSKWRELPSPD